MVDSVQKTSLIPLPQHQTTTGQHDPLPLNGQEATKKVDDKQAQTGNETSSSNFEAYLNQQSITALERTQKGSQFDPASDITSSSPYSGSGETTPL